MNADGADERLLTRDDGNAEDRDPAWSPDGRWIAFSSNRQSDAFQLYLIDPAGGEPAARDAQRRGRSGTGLAGPLSGHAASRRTDSITGGKVSLSANKSNLESLLRDAIAAAREGDKTRARALFEQVTELDQRNEKAWFWLASLVETDEERRVCLGNVITINPANERAKKAALAARSPARRRKKPGPRRLRRGISRKMLIIGVGRVRHYRSAAVRRDRPW